MTFMHFQRELAILLWQVLTSTSAISIFVKVLTNIMQLFTIIKLMQ